MISLLKIPDSYVFFDIFLSFLFCIEVSGIESNDFAPLRGAG